MEPHKQPFRWFLALPQHHRLKWMQSKAIQLFVLLVLAKVLVQIWIRHRLVVAHRQIRQQAPPAQHLQIKLNHLNRIQVNQVKNRPLETRKFEQNDDEIFYFFQINVSISNQSIWTLLGNKPLAHKLWLKLFNKCEQCKIALNHSFSSTMIYYKMSQHSKKM